MFLHFGEWDVDIGERGSKVGMTKLKSNLVIIDRLGQGEVAHNIREERVKVHLVSIYFFHYFIFKFTIALLTGE